MITIIVALTARRGAIGLNGDLLYHIKADMQHFKALTTGHTVVMGRRTFDSLPGGALPGRRNIVVTRNSGLRLPGAETAPSLEAAIALARKPQTNAADSAAADSAAADSEIFILGGAQIYSQALSVADRLELTLIDAPAEREEQADTFFPAIDTDRWEIERESEPQTTAKGTAYRFVTMRRR